MLVVAYLRFKVIRNRLLSSCLLLGLFSPPFVAFPGVFIAFSVIQKEIGLEYMRTEFRACFLKMKAENFKICLVFSFLHVGFLETFLLISPVGSKAKKYVNVYTPKCNDGLFRRSITYT